MSWTIGILLACQQYSLTLICFYYAKQFQNTTSDAETQEPLFPIFLRGLCASYVWQPSESWLVNSKFTCVNRSKVMTIKKYFILYSNVLFKKTFQGQSFSLFVILREYGVRMEATCEKDVIDSLAFLSYSPSLGPVECWPRTGKQLKKWKPILTYVWGYGG